MITFVDQGNDLGSNMLFNGNVIKTDAWDTPTEAYPSSKINVENLDVKSNLLASGNNMGFQDTGTSGMQADLSFLVVTLGILGDVNQDNEITSADAVMVLEMAVRGEYSYVADVSGDGAVTSLDALMILQAVGTVS